MKIGIDGRVLEKPMTGIGRYLINILNEIPKYDTNNDYFIFLNRNQNHINNSFYKYVMLDMPFLSSKLMTPFWLNNIIPSLIKKYNIKIFIGPNILVPSKKIEGCEFISIVHDIMPLTHPQFFPLFYRKFLKRYLPSSVNSSDIIITISNSSKKDIIEYFKVPESKIKVVYNTISPRFRKLDESEKKFLESKTNLSLPEKYLLYVGVIEKRKNIDMIIKIAEKLRSVDEKLKIVLAGRYGYGSDELKDKIQKLSDVILIYNKVNDEDLLLLYNLAFAFIFPSYVEGFGIPPLEAMACGKPVIASNCDALREIIGENGMLCEPDDLNCFIEKIELLNQDSSLYESFVSKSVNNSKRFSIKNTIESFLGVINSVNMH